MKEKRSFISFIIVLCLIFSNTQAAFGGAGISSEISGGFYSAQGSPEDPEAPEETPFDFNINCRCITINAEAVTPGSVITVASYEESGRFRSAVSAVLTGSSLCIETARLSISPGNRISAYLLSEEHLPVRSAITKVYVPGQDDHVYEQTRLKEPTCTEAGLIMKTCSVCGKKTDEAAAPLGHKSVTDAAVAAACTSGGLTEGCHCERCGEVLIRQTEIPPAGHKWTCDHCGEEARYCIFCGYSDGVIPDHEYVNNLCTRCGDSQILSLSLNASSLNMMKGDCGQLFANAVLKVTGTTCTIFWQSSNSSVVSVSTDGAILANSAGTAVITASCGGITAKCRITVKRYMAAVSSVLDPLTLVTGYFSVSGTGGGSAGIPVGEGGASCDAGFCNAPAESENGGSAGNSVGEGGASTEIPLGEGGASCDAGFCNAPAESENGRSSGVAVCEGEGGFPQSEDANIWKIIRDPEGGSIALKDPDLTYHGSEDASWKSAIKEERGPAGSPHNVTGSTITICGYEWDYSMQCYEMKVMSCVFVGEHCTVWMCVSDYDAIRIDEERARAIAECFDENWLLMRNSFGDWYDADGDGKLAIYCYDIDNDYRDGVGDTYVGGFFRKDDMTDVNGKIGGYYSSEFHYLEMNTDCIHIDTYPLMGRRGRLLADVEQCYEVLFHEFQHMINFSYRVENTSAGFCSSDMEDYLNEAMSLAAEEIVLGTDTLTDRIGYFNSSSYVRGTSLTYWPEIGATLSNYSNSCLFGQYIRTRYAALTGTSGNGIFKQILQARQQHCGGDTLSYIAELLGTDKTSLVADFWAAVLLNEPSGKRGFNGEAWAGSLRAANKVFEYPAGNSGGIYNGGCKYYKVSVNYTEGVFASPNVRFYLY